MKLYIAGKIGANSQFGTQYWRDEFVTKLAELSGLELTHLDPLAYENDRVYDPQFVFEKDCWLISQAECVIVYLSDDISVGGSQEMIIAKYLKKPLIGLAPKEGKFNKSRKEHLGTVIENYVDPFVYVTCDSVCNNVEEVAGALTKLPDPKGISIIDVGVKNIEEKLA
jgi:hypothetical protein